LAGGGDDKEAKPPSCGRRLGRLRRRDEDAGHEYDEYDDENASFADGDDASTNNSSSRTTGAEEEDDAFFFLLAEDGGDSGDGADRFGSTMVVAILMLLSFFFDSEERLYSHAINILPIPAITDVCRNSYLLTPAIAGNAEKATTTDATALHPPDSSTVRRKKS
jgi:hypothetical protein